MRQNLVIALLSACLTLLCVNLYVSFSKQPLPAALGQAVGTPTGSVAIATVQGTSQDPWCYIYDIGTQRLAVYKVQNQGIELKGVRQITWDMKLEELNPKLAAQRLPVSVIKAELEKAASGK